MDSFILREVCAGTLPSFRGWDDEAESITRAIGETIPGLSFTEDGTESLLNDARVQYTPGQIQSECGNEDAARAHWNRAVLQEGYRSLAFGYLAAQKLENVESFDWQKRLEDALSAAGACSGFNTGLAVYAQGCLLTPSAEVKRALPGCRKHTSIRTRGCPTI